MAQAQDFIKGWPHQELLTGADLRYALSQSFMKGLEMSHEALNYGDAANGAYMMGHPKFRQSLAAFLEKQYGQPVDWKTLMSMGGASMATDVAIRQHCKPGDIAVVEEPTYYLSFNMIRANQMTIKGVPMESDGMDLVALEKLLKEEGGKIKMVYTVPVHHNPTGVCMSEAKRTKLVALAREYNFVIVADEAYQLLNFGGFKVKPMFFYDDAANPRVLGISTFSKLIGPGIKIGWVHAHEALLKPLTSIGFIDSGNNPVIYNSCNLIDFMDSGALAKHIDMVSADLSERCDLMVAKLIEVGLEPVKPKGGYFVWVKSKGKATGRNGQDMSVNKDQFGDCMRLCFAWLPKEKIVEGIEFLRQ